MFSRSCSFLTAKKHISNQAKKAMYCLIKRSKYLCLPIDLQIDLFNKIVKPILLYGCEIWGYGNIDIIERVQLNFLKHILNMKSSTPNCMVYGESGVKPISVDIDTRIISFWSKLVVPQQQKLTNTMYGIYLSHFKYTDPVASTRFLWIKNVKRILIKCGLNNVWEYHEFPNHKWLNYPLG